MISSLRRTGSRRLSEKLVRERQDLVGQNLEVARLRENLVHEEYHRQVTDVYDFKEGKEAKEAGGFGVVQAVRNRKTGTQYAMKTIPLSRVKTKERFDFVMKEVDVLKSLEHPNIVRLQEVYVTPSHLHVAMDLITGGNLAVRYRFEGEERAAVIIRQVVRALRYLHDHRIAGPFLKKDDGEMIHVSQESEKTHKAFTRKYSHRSASGISDDLKLENILLEDDGGKRDGVPCVKLIDFGFSSIFEEGGVSTHVLGSWNYVAPEVIKGQYRPAPADMWSLGVIAYVLMSGSLPFDADRVETIKRKVLASKYHFSGKMWIRASETSKHFIRSMLQKRPELRLTATAALGHAWLREAEEESQAPRKDATFAAEVTRAMLDFREANGMMQLGRAVLARTLDPAQIHQLVEEFDRADNTNDGKVSLAEFKRWLKANCASKAMTDEDMETLFNSVDFDNTGSIDFNEFLAATIQQWQLDEANLRPAFDRLDRSHTGFINLADVTLTTGSMATEAESAVLVSYFDYNGDGQISFQEFVKGMRRMRGSPPGRKDLMSQAEPSSPTVPPTLEPIDKVAADRGSSNGMAHDQGTAGAATAAFCSDSGRIAETACVVEGRGSLEDGANGKKGKSDADPNVDADGVDEGVPLKTEGYRNKTSTSTSPSSKHSNAEALLAAERRSEEGKVVGIGREKAGAGETGQAGAGEPRRVDESNGDGSGRGVRTSGCGCVLS